MFPKFVVALLASALVAPVAAMPQPVSKVPTIEEMGYQTFQSSSIVSSFGKRKKTFLYLSMCISDVP